ncbi:hypothetical protein AMTRI_Chr05g59950 [Amborella trichopoda]
MEKVLDEHELTQNPMARESKIRDVKDCLSPGSMIQERIEEKTTPQVVAIKVEGTNLQETQDTPVLDSGAGAYNPNLVLKLNKRRNIHEESRFRLKIPAHKNSKTSL